MMRRKNSPGAFVALLLIVVVMSACTPPALISPAQQTAIAATGVAAANRLLTAIPPSAMAGGSTATASPGVPVTGATMPPVTSTASPAATSGSSGSIPNTGATPAATAPIQGAQTGTNCAGLLNSGAAGPLATLWINNDTTDPINLTMGISIPNSLGQCGSMTWGPIKAGQSIRVHIPVTQTSLGDPCYWAWAVTVNQGRQTIISGETAGYCITTSQRWVINVHLDRIRLVGP